MKNEIFNAGSKVITFKKKRKPSRSACAMDPMSCNYCKCKDHNKKVFFLSDR